MNQVYLSGYLASDPEGKLTANGKTVCRFRLAVRRTEEITDFLTITCWEQTAKFAMKWLRKGSGAELRCELHGNQWTDDSGQKKYRTEIVAREIEFGKSGKRREVPGDTPEERQAESPVPAAYDEVFPESDEDFPF